MITHVLLALLAALIAIAAVALITALTVVSTLVGGVLSIGITALVIWAVVYGVLCLIRYEIEAHRHNAHEQHYVD